MLIKTISVSPPLIGAIPPTGATVVSEALPDPCPPEPANRAGSPTERISISMIMSFFMDCGVFVNPRLFCLPAVRCAGIETDFIPAERVISVRSAWHSIQPVKAPDPNSSVLENSIPVLPWLQCSCHCKSATMRVV